ncbi:hypothetical protein VE00_05768 [Pseudogymnoascus sp. WSF 3629]|nr:hypothetical protein VE00_05768 [Pseudogymnoascus sp. WSF 3629]
MFDADKWRQPYHPSRQHPRRDLTLRYFEVLFSIVVVVLSFPYVFRVPPNLVASSKYNERPDAVTNAYFVLSMLFGFFMTALTIIICAVRIWLLHFRPDRAPNTSSSLNQFNASPYGSQNLRWTMHRSRTNQDSGLLLFWVMSLIWWNVARLLPVGTQYPIVSDLLQIIISIIVALQM